MVRIEITGLDDLLKFIALLQGGPTAAAQLLKVAERVNQADSTIEQVTDQLGKVGAVVNP